MRTLIPIGFATIAALFFIGGDLTASAGMSAFAGLAFVGIRAMERLEERELRELLEECDPAFADD